MDAAEDPAHFEELSLGTYPVGRGRWWHVHPIPEEPELEEGCRLEEEAQQRFIASVPADACLRRMGVWTWAPFSEQRQAMRNMLEGQYAYQ